MHIISNTSIFTGSESENFFGLEKSRVLFSFLGNFWLVVFTLALGFSIVVCMSVVVFGFWGQKKFWCLDLWSREKVGGFVDICGGYEFGVCIHILAKTTQYFWWKTQFCISKYWLNAFLVVGEKILEVPLTIFTVCEFEKVQYYRYFRKNYFFSIFINEFLSSLVFGLDSLCPEDLQEA